MHRSHLEVEHAVLLVLRAEPRLQTRKTAAGLLAASHHLAPRAFHVHHVVQLVQPAAPTDAVPVIPVAAWGIQGIIEGVYFVAGGREEAGRVFERASVEGSALNAKRVGYPDAISTVSAV